MNIKAWDGVIEAPESSRSSKPRSTGITMVIDKGLGLNQVDDFVATAGDYVDVVKLTFGTSAFYNFGLLQEKIRRLKAGGILVMPGGTFLEVAVWRDVVEPYLTRARELGFTAIEVSDGTIEIPLDRRREVIRQCLDWGFTVITEVGKKDPREAPSLSELIDTARHDIANGAFKVIVEAREAGRGVGIFDQQGKTKPEEMEKIASGVGDPDLLIWEAPLKNQQQDLILRFGPNVNLGNIPPEEVLALEALRQGLRGDTLKRAVEASPVPRK